MSEITLGRRRALLLAPLGASLLAGAGFAGMLSGLRHGSFDPHDIHAPVVGRPIPIFDLPALAPAPGFSARDLAGQSVPILVNFFASWCVPCVLEAATLSGLDGTVPIWGIAYKDAADRAAGFVARSGSPYRRIVSDLAGSVAIDWGVSGVPESFLVAPGGTIVWHLPGPLDDEAIRHGLQPALAAIKR